MMVNKKIKFKKYEILNSEMLNELYEFPHNIVKINYNNYSDGIIIGLDFFYKDEKLYLSKGIIKHCGELFMLESDYNLTSLIQKQNELGENECFVNIKNATEKEENGINYKELEIDISNKASGFFLGFFIYRKDKPIYCVYNKYDDFTDANYIDIKKREYASTPKPVVAPIIVNNFSLELIKINKNINYFDSIIIGKSLNNERIHHSLLTKYFEYYKLSFSHETIIDRFSEILLKKRASSVKKIENPLPPQPKEIDSNFVSVDID